MPAAEARKLLEQHKIQRVKLGVFDIEQVP